MLLSLMMRSHGARSRAAANVAALSTRSNCRANPARLSSSARSSASASESSTNNSRSGLLIGPYLKKAARSEHVCDSRNMLSAMAYHVPVPRGTIGAQPMAEFGGGVLAHERLHRFPGAGLVLDALAARADRQDSLERPHVGDGRLERLYQRALVLVGQLPVEQEGMGAAVLVDHKKEEQRDQQHLQACRRLGLQQRERDERRPEHGEGIRREGPAIGDERIDAPGQESGERHQEDRKCRRRHTRRRERRPDTPRQSQRDHDDTGYSDDRTRFRGRVPGATRHDGPGQDNDEKYRRPAHQKRTGQYRSGQQYHDREQEDVERSGKPAVVAEHRCERPVFGHVPSSTSRTLRASAAGVNGFCRKWRPGSSIP